MSKYIGCSLIGIGVLLAIPIIYIGIAYNYDTDGWLYLINPLEIKGEEIIPGVMRFVILFMIILGIFMVVKSNKRQKDGK
ncbi:MAG: hypothetical protein ACR2FK_06070 [Sphingomicrobium sp.]